MYKTITMIQQLKMIKNSSVFCFTLKTILPQLLVPSVSQRRFGLTKLQANTPYYCYSDDLKLNLKNLSHGLSFGIVQAKNPSSIIHEAPTQNHLKRVQKTGQTIHCFDPKTHKEVDVPIRIFRTHYTVTFMPSENFLQKRYSNEKLGEHMYNPVKDITLSTYKFECQKCGHSDARTFPQNGFKFGTVLTGCDNCSHVELVSDHLGWVQKGQQKMSRDLMYNIKFIENLMRKQLKKVGLFSKEDEQ